jgi:hypothetical protein
VSVEPGVHSPQHANSSVFAERLAVSIASFHEQLLGANAIIARVRNPSGLVDPYARLWDVFDSFRKSTVLPSTPPPHKN